MLQKSKRFLRLFMITLSLVCCLSMFTACKKGKKGSSENPDGGKSAEIVELSAEMLTLEYETVVFDGSAKEPTVTVKNGETTIEATEYNVSYSNNTGVGTATVTVSAKDDSDVIEGSASKNFTITIAELPEIETMEEGIWTGSSVLPTVRIGSLVLETDFDVSWEYKENGADDSEYIELDTETNNFVNEGYYRVTATGKGNYEGTQTAVYAIKKGLSEITLTVDSETYNDDSYVTYDGKSHAPEIVVGSLVLGTDYELSYEYAPNGTNNFVPYGVEDSKDAFVSAGQYKVIVKGLGLYGGTQVKIFTIHGIAIPTFQLTGTQATYDGSPKTIGKPISELTENVDYVVTYEYKEFGEGAYFEPYTNPSFVYAGVYKVIATGIGNYEGTESAEFTINRATRTVSVEKADYIFNAETEKISLSGIEESSASVYYYTADPTIGSSVTNEGWEEYTLGMKLDAGTYYVYAAVEASRNYLEANSNIDTFTVIKDELKGIMSLNGLEITYDGNAHKPTFIITSKLNSNPLVEGQDYELEWKFFDTNNPLAPEIILDANAEFINVGQYTVTLKGIGNYDVADPLASNMTTYFTIIPIDFDNFSVSRENWTYGEDPTKIDIKATNTTGNSVLELEDVTITYYYVKDGTTAEVEFTEETELDAGFYYIIAKATKENYNIKKTAKKSTATFEVRKAELSDVSLSLTEENDVTTINLTGYDAQEFGGEVKYYFNTVGSNEAGNILTEQVLEELDAGTYYVYAEITGMTNYEDIKTEAVQFIIAE